MLGGDDRDEVILEIRRRSIRLLEAAFGAMALIAIGIGLLVHHHPSAVAFVEEAPEAVAHCFLVMGICYAATMLIWEHVYAAPE